MADTSEKLPKTGPSDGNHSHTNAIKNLNVYICKSNINLKHLPPHQNRKCKRCIPIWSVFVWLFFFFGIFALAVSFMCCSFCIVDSNEINHY